MKQHIVRIAALGLSTTAIIGAGSTFTAGYAATSECTADSAKLIETIAAVTHTESRYAKTVPGAHHDAVTHVVHHAAETHDVVVPGGYAYTQRTTGRIVFKDSATWNPGKGWDRTPPADVTDTITDKAAWDEVVVDTAAYDEPDTVLYYTGKPAGTTNIDDAAWVRYSPTGWPSKVDTRTVTEAPETYVCDFVKPVTTLTNPEPLVRPGYVFELQTTDNHLVTKTVGNVYRDGALFKSFQSPTGSLSVPANLPDGAYTLRYNGLDSVGNVASTSTYDFVVDGTAPTVTDKGTAGAAAQSKSFKVFDARRVDKVTINGVTKDLTNNNWSDINDIKPGRYGAVEGNNTLVAYDVAGNTTEVTFVLDVTAPTARDKGEDGAVARSKSYALADNHKVGKVTVNGVTKDLTDNKWSDINGIEPGRFGGVEGKNTLVVYDQAGNASAPMEFVLDTTGPVITEKDGSSETSRSFKLDDGALGAKVAGVRVNGTDFPLSVNRWSDANDLEVGNWWGVHAGENTLVAYDTLGNESTTTFTIAGPEAGGTDPADSDPQAEPETAATPGEAASGEATPGEAASAETVSAPAAPLGVATPSDAGPVATTTSTAGPAAHARTALAPELARAPFAGAGQDSTPTATATLDKAQAVRTVAAATPTAVDDSLPGLGIAIVAGCGALALGAAFGLRAAGRRA